MIKKLDTDQELKICTGVINSSFKTVADEFHFTPENAPTNPAYIDFENVKESILKGTSFYGLFNGNILIGCIAVEKSKDDNQMFYIERLSVLPEYRHKGYGRELMDHAFNIIKDNKGRIVSIGIVNENKRLKDWYIKYGFTETGIKKFQHLPFTVCFMKKEVD